jgi:hypothetical protein
MENSNRRKDRSLKKELDNVVQEIALKKYEETGNRKISPIMKTGMYVGGAIIVVWLSQYVFSAFEGAIRQFKKLRRTIREK